MRGRKLVLVKRIVSAALAAVLVFAAADFTALATETEVESVDAKKIAAEKQPVAVETAESVENGDVKQPAASEEDNLDTVQEETGGGN